MIVYCSGTSGRNARFGATVISSALLEMPPWKPSRNILKNKANYYKDTMMRYIKNNDFVAVAMGELVGPMAKTEDKAVSLLTEYLLDDAGRNSFYEVYPDASESEYYEALYELYDKEEKGNRKELLNGASDTSCQFCSETDALVLS